MCVIYTQAGKDTAARAAAPLRKVSAAAGAFLHVCCSLEVSRIYIHTGLSTLEIRFFLFVVWFASFGMYMYINSITNESRAHVIWSISRNCTTARSIYHTLSANIYKNSIHHRTLGFPSIGSLLRAVYALSLSIPRLLLYPAVLAHFPSASSTCRSCVTIICARRLQPSGRIGENA